MTTPLTVSIESPYHNDDPAKFRRNINYAILAVKDVSVNFGEAPYASHLELTQCVVDHEHTYVSDTTYADADD